jgi:hypothetical protein
MANAELLPANGGEEDYNKPFTFCTGCIRVNMPDHGWVPLEVLGEKLPPLRSSTCLGCLSQYAKAGGGEKEMIAVIS